MLLALWACAPGDPASDPALAPMTPDLALVDVTDRLHRAAEIGNTDRDRALSVLASARLRFETSLEPGLRETRDPLDVAATEYAFARAHRAFADGKDGSAEIDVLLLKLRPARVARAEAP